VAAEDTAASRGLPILGGIPGLGYQAQLTWWSLTFEWGEAYTERDKTHSGREKRCRGSPLRMPQPPASGRNRSGVPVAPSVAPKLRKQQAIPKRWQSPAQAHSILMQPNPAWERWCSHGQPWPSNNGWNSQDVGHVVILTREP
jgi:hypothetical protein